MDRRPWGKRISFSNASNQARLSRSQIAMGTSVRLHGRSRLTRWFTPSQHLQKTAQRETTFGFLKAARRGPSLPRDLTKFLRIFRRMVDGWPIRRTSRDGNEVYVVSYPEPGAPILISTNGGVAASWNPNGRELFYIEPGQQGPGSLSVSSGLNRIMSVTVTTSPKFSADRPLDVYSRLASWLGTSCTATMSHQTLSAFFLSETRTGRRYDPIASSWCRTGRRSSRECCLKKNEHPNP
jgi:hypothetical protein